MNNGYYDKKCRLENLRNGGGVKYLLGEVSKILNNPIMLFDTSYTHLASTEGVVTDDWVWNEIATLGTFTQKTVDFFKQEKFIEAYAVSETVAYMKSEHLKYDRYNGKLFDKDNVQLGNISIVSCFEPFGEGIVELIELACEILSVELQNSEFYPKIDRVFHESLINQLISGNTSGIDRDALAELYNGLKDNLYLVVADITRYDTTNTHLAYFRDLFKKLANGFKYYIHLNNILIIISTDNEVFSANDVLGELHEFLERYEIYAGISSRFQNILELDKYFREAITALNYGMVSKRTRYIFSYDDFRVEHFLRSTVTDTADICAPIISSIKKYDKETGSCLLDTLYIYLMHGMDKLLTCEKTGLTHDGLSRKLCELQDVFKIDWDNGDMLFSIFISIKLDSDL